MKKTIVAACAALTVAGCGGEDGLTRKQLAKEANAICEKYSKQGEALGSPDLADPAKAADYFTKAKGLTEKQQAELEDLKPVESVKADYKALTDATDGFTVLLADLATAAEAEDQEKGAELLQKLPDMSAQVDEAAAKVGADDCAS